MVIATIGTITGIVSSIITAILFILGLIKAILEFLLQGVLGLIQVALIPFQTLFGWILFRTDRLIDDLDTMVYPDHPPEISELEFQSVSNPFGNLTKIIQMVISEVQSLIGEIILMYSPLFPLILPMIAVLGLVMIFPISAFVYYRVALAALGFFEFFWNILLQAYATIWNTIIVPQLDSFMPVWNELMLALWDIVQYLWGELIGYFCGAGDPLATTLAGRCPNLSIVINYLINSLPGLLVQLQAAFNFFVNIFNGLEDIVCPGASCSQDFCLRATSGASIICNFTIEGLFTYLLSLFTDFIDIVIPLISLTITFIYELLGILSSVFGVFLLDIIEGLSASNLFGLTIPTFITNFISSFIETPPFNTETMAVPVELQDLQSVYVFILNTIYYAGTYVLGVVVLLLEALDTLLCNILSDIKQCIGAKTCSLFFSTTLNITVNTFFGPINIPVNLSGVCTTVGFVAEECSCDACIKSIEAPVNIDIYTFITAATIVNLGNRPFNTYETGIVPFTTGFVYFRYNKLGELDRLPSLVFGGNYNGTFNDLYFNQAQIDAIITPVGLKVWMACRKNFEGCLTHACLPGNSIFRTWINPKSEALRYNPP